MPEQVTLTTPEVIPAISTTFYRVVTLNLDWRGQRILIVLQGENGELKGFDYEGADAITMMTALNKANLSVQSLQRRVLNRLIMDGHITGAVAGSPD